MVVMVVMMLDNDTTLHLLQSQVPVVQRSLWASEAISRALGIMLQWRRQTRPAAPTPKNVPTAKAKRAIMTGMGSRGSSTLSAGGPLYYARTSAQLKNLN